MIEWLIWIVMVHAGTVETLYMIPVSDRATCDEAAVQLNERFAEWEGELGGARVIATCAERRFD